MYKKLLIILRYNLFLNLGTFLFLFLKLSLILYQISNHRILMKINNNFYV